jgi:hypothetical protein
LHEQNARLNRLLAEAELEMDALREVAKESSEPSRQAPHRRHAQGHVGMSERLACKAVRLARSTYRRLPLAATSADRPIRFISLIGFIVSLLSFGYGWGFVVIPALFGYRNEAGFPTLVALLSFLSGPMIIILGIIGNTRGGFTTS